MNRSSLAAFAILSITSLTVIAKGPDGFGELRLGMTKGQIEAIGSESTVHLSAPLTLFKPDSKYYRPVAGVDLFNTKIQSSLDEKPLDATLRFTEGKLSRILIAFADDSSALKIAMEMISSKYGPPQEVNRMTEKLCINRNGTNFKIDSGEITYSWVSSAEGPSSVETKLIKKNLGICPGLGIGLKDTKFEHLVIMPADEASAKPNNPF